MNKLELQEYFLNQLTNGECYIKVGKGKATYKMNRGSFTTRDMITDRHLLRFRSKDQNRYIFSDGKVEAEIIVDQQEEIKFHFHVDYGYNRFIIRFKTFEDEKIYGCGEQYTEVDLKGQEVPIWVSEHQQTMKIVKKLLREKIKGVNPSYHAPYKNHQTYCSIPSFMSSKNYAFYCHEDSYGKLVFKKDEVLIKFRQFPQSITLLTANSQKELIENQSKLVGISPALPSWVHDGAIIAVQGGTEEIKKKYEDAKKAGVKIAALWAQDWCGNVVTSFGYQVYWNWKAADDGIYKGLKEFIEELNKEGIRFLGYINTFLKENAPLYNEAKEKKLLVRRKDGTPYLIKSTTFNAGIVDLTNPTAYEWYKNVIKENMIAYGLSGWMADFGEYLPTDSVVYGGSAERLHNKWPTLWAKCNYDAINEANAQKEVFIFSRAAYGHTVKYTNSIWNGDQHVDYSDEYGLGSVIPASISLACSGCGVTHSDIGGYTTIMWMTRGAELLNRWSEMNVFSPIFRTHESNRPNDNVQFNHQEVIEEFATNSNIFFDLKQYRVDVEKEYQENGTPMIRPLFTHYEDEYSKTTMKEYLFGSDILVSPVLREKEATHKVVLPKGSWVQFFTNKEFKEGEYEIPSPLGMPIAFYKKASSYIELFNNISNKYKKGE